MTNNKQEKEIVIQLHITIDGFHLQNNERERRGAGRRTECGRMAKVKLLFFFFP